ncbi:MAG: hypothetical protein R3E65_07840 [Steroidobacteraceae bacterium]
MAPSWDNVVRGQINLRDAVHRQIDFTSPEGKAYRLIDKPAVLIVRPRGWHLYEKHMLFRGEAIGRVRGFRPLPLAQPRGAASPRHGRVLLPAETRGHREARLWAEVFDFAEQRVGLGQHQCTVLIETILAAFEMDEILQEAARQHRRPELRPLGLHLQLHQEVREAPGLRAARSLLESR